MRSQCLIQKQMQGLSLSNEETKTEYHLKTKSGVLMAVFQHREHAEEYRQKQLDKWGQKAPIALLFRVTTTIEQL